MNRFTVLCVLCVCLCAGVSCSSGTKKESPGASSASSSQPVAGVVNACELVKLEDVREYYEPQMSISPSGTQTDTGPAADLSKCLYRTSGPGGHFVSVMVRVSHAGEDAWGNYDLFIKQSKAELSDFRYEDVEGLGVKAIWQTEGGATGRLTAFLGTAQLGVSANASAGKGQKDIAIALMKKALARFRSAH